jgi:glycosyltransferase 2 family protein
LKFNLQSRLSVILSVAVSAGLITWLIGRMDLARAVDLLQQARAQWLFLAVCLAMLIPFCGTCRWIGVVRAHDNVKFPLMKAWRGVMLSYALNSFLPSKTGDFAKALYFRKAGGISLGVGAVVLERLVDLLVLGTLGITAGLVSMNYWGITVGLILLLGTTLAFIVILFLNETKIPLPEEWKARSVKWALFFGRWLNDPGSVALTVGGSLANWSLAGLIFCALVTSLTGTYNWGYLLAVFPLAILAGLVPFTVSGIGTRDSAFVVLLTGHLTTEGATMVALCYTVLAYWLIGLLGVPVALKEIIAYLRGRTE